MLILGRRTGEVIRIGDDISIVVVQIRNGDVKLGVSAPRQISVHRQEIYDAIHQSPDDMAASDAANMLADQTIVDRIMREDYPHRGFRG